MKAKLTLLLLILFFSHSKAEAKEGKWKKYFRGIELNGYTSPDLQTFNAGAELRWENYILVHSLYYRKDTVYQNYYGLNTTVKRYFLLPKVHLMPFLQLSGATSVFQPNHRNDNNDGYFPLLVVTVAAGAGTYIELSKYFQIGGSLNYEYIISVNQRAYFDWLPLIHLKYEFRFI